MDENEREIQSIDREVMEHELVVVKPDAVRRGLVGEVISRFESKGFVLKRMESLQLTRNSAKQLYSVHKDKPFFDGLIEFMCDGICVAIIFERHNAVMLARHLIGAMGPAGNSSLPGTIRGDYALDGPANIVHASDNSDQAAYEACVLFGDSVADLFTRNLCA